MERPDVLVVGGGLSGLAAAARLAQGGAHVLVLEANARLGGALAGCPAGRYRPEVGPIWIDDLPRLEQGLGRLGAKLTDKVRLLPVDPLMRYEVGDGRRVVVPRDLAKAAEAIEAAFPGEGKGYRALMESHGDLSEDDGPDGPSLDTYAREFLRSEEVRELVYSFARLQVLEPQAVPAFELPLARAHRYGAYVPEGGFHRITDAFADLARLAGAQFVMGARVQELIVEDGRVTGAHLVGGLKLRAKAVVATAPASQVLSAWIPQTPKSPEAGRVISMRLVAPSFTIQRGLESPPEKLPYLTFMGRGDRAADQDGATIQIIHATALDAEVAPPGRGLIRIQASLDYPAGGGSWGLRRKALAKAVLHRVEATLGEEGGVGEEILRFHDPELLSALLRLSARSIYPAMTRWQTGVGRVAIKPGVPQGLFLAGCWTTHGTGVGGTALSGIQAAEFALAEVGSKAAGRG